MIFNEAMKHVLRWEGGYVNDPKDPGGETKFGISKRAYPKEDIKNLTVKRAKEIYFKDYWLKGKCDLLPDRVAIFHLDTCILHGSHAAAKMLQRASRVYPDGMIGAQTLLAAAKLDLKDYYLERVIMYTKIILNRRTSIRFLKGWLRRCVDTQDFANNMWQYSNLSDEEFC